MQDSQQSARRRGWPGGCGFPPPQRCIRLTSAARHHPPGPQPAQAGRARPAAGDKGGRPAQADPRRHPHHVRGRGRHRPELFGPRQLLRDQAARYRPVPRGGPLHRGLLVHHRQAATEVGRNVTTAGPLRILLVEDNPGDALLIHEMLGDRQGTFALETVDRLAPALERLRTNGIDLVLLDLTLPDSARLNTFTAVQLQAPNVPIVVLTGLSDEALAVSTVRDGAQDYLVKGQVDGNLLW